MRLEVRRRPGTAASGRWSPAGRPGRPARPGPTTKSRPSAHCSSHQPRSASADSSAETRRRVGDAGALEVVQHQGSCPHHDVLGCHDDHCDPRPRRRLARRARSSTSSCSTRAMREAALGGWGRPAAAQRRPRGRAPLARAVRGLGGRARDRPAGLGGAAHARTRIDRARLVDLGATFLELGARGRGLRLPRPRPRDRPRGLRRDVRRARRRPVALPRVRRGARRRPRLARRDRRCPAWSR